MKKYVGVAVTQETRRILREKASANGIPIAQYIQLLADLDVQLHWDVRLKPGVGVKSPGSDLKVNKFSTLG
jgi:hypothetical protein